MPEASIDHGILTVAEQRTSMRRPVRVKFRDARSFALRSLVLPPDLPDFHPHSSWDPRRSGAS